MGIIQQSTTIDHFRLPSQPRSQTQLCCPTMTSSLAYFFILPGLILLIKLGNQQFANAQNEGWCYTLPSCGASTWNDTCRSGMMQSPIDLIEPDGTTFADWNAEFSPAFCNEAIGFYIHNNGHSTELNLDKDMVSRTINMKGEAFNNTTYIFVQMHFHWGSVDTQGSEHTLNGTAYPLELHLVFMKEKFENIMAAVASGEGDALAVLGIFFEVAPANPANPNLAPIVDTFKCINDTRPSDMYEYKFKRLHLARLLPPSREIFRYVGSLTTPGCHERVLWTVFKTPVQISPAQLEEFRHLESAHGDPPPGQEARPHGLADNFRPVQLLGTRIVETRTLVSTSSC